MGQQMLVAELEIIVVRPLQVLHLGLPPDYLGEHRCASGWILAWIVVEDPDAE